jgi:8-oxo-dGTP pyrophosphatase MutT (NUDIX family)
MLKKSAQKRSKAVNQHRAENAVPLNVAKGGKRELRTQFGALCYRVSQGKVQVLLVTSRTRKRWIIPKGWPANGMTPAEAAAQEAWEEGGAVGKVSNMCFGIYSYVKYLPKDDLPCVVAVFPMQIKKLAKSYPEQNQRRRKWFSPKKAAKKVMEPELREILGRFDPKTVW